MENTNNKEFGTVICTKDNNVYVYQLEQNNPLFLRDDFEIVDCFPFKNGHPDFSNKVEILAKYLVEEN